MYAEDGDRLLQSYEFQLPTWDNFGCLHTSGDGCLHTSGEFWKAGAQDRLKALCLWIRIQGPGVSLSTLIGLWTPVGAGTSLTTPNG